VENLRTTAAVHDKHRSNHSYITGDRLTLAGFNIAGPFSQNERTKPAERVPDLGAWQQRLLQTVPGRAATKGEFDERIGDGRNAAGIRL
jgi:glutathione S-transferase